MRKDFRNALLLPVIGLAAAVALAPALAQDTLPPGPGAEETMKACGGCHGILQISGLKRNAEEWSNTVNTMIGLGAPVPPADFDKVVNYLATYYGLNPPPADVPAQAAPPASPAAPALPDPGVPAPQGNQ